MERIVSNNLKPGTLPLPYSLNFRWPGTEVSPSPLAHHSSGWSDVPILPQSSLSIESGLATGALVRPHRIMTSEVRGLERSMEQGWVVKVEEEEMYDTCEGVEVCVRVWRLV